MVTTYIGAWISFFFLKVSTDLKKTLSLFRGLCFTSGSICCSLVCTADIISNISISMIDTGLDKCHNTFEN